MAPSILREDHEQREEHNEREDVFDYIIAGGGTSGCVLAGRLAEDPNLRILVIEAGPDSSTLDNTRMTGGWSQLFDSNTDWNISSTPSRGLNDRSIKNSRGRFLGGSSGCNGTLCIRGTETDYDDWGLPGWSGKDMFRAMAHAESFHSKDWFESEASLHGTDGPLHIEPHDLAPISERVMQSYIGAGLPYDADMFTHGRRAVGCGHAPRTVYQGTRTTGADFVTNTYRRENVTIWCDTLVDRVLFESCADASAPGGVGQRAVGVVCVPSSSDASQRTESFNVRAEKEVIVSGGAYCTPAILLRSGIGPSAELEAQDIECVADVPGVGKNLMDHLIVFIFYEVGEPGLTTDHLVYDSTGKAFETSYLLWKNERKGFLSTFPFGAFAFARMDERLADVEAWKAGEKETGNGRDAMGLTKKQPNIEFFHTECYGGPKQFANFPSDNESAFAIIPELFAPRSRGSVTLLSKDPAENPRVDHNYLGDKDGLDILVLGEACRWANEIVTAGKGTKAVVKGSWPKGDRHHEMSTREEWEGYARENATTCYHPGGTAKMGKAEDAMAVVDEKLRVRGVQGLRVCDVSVMPTLNQGHTQMPAYGIAERCAEIIKEGLRQK